MRTLDFTPEKRYNIKSAPALSGTGTVSSAHGSTKKDRRAVKQPSV